MPTPRHEPSRSAILHAATAEFAREGETGARMDAIARAAGVNKALLHYYFGTKEALYGVVLEEVFTGLLERYLRGLNGPGTPGERLLRHFLNHFDHLASQGTFTRLMGHEMMRARAGQSTRISHIVDLAFRPLHEALAATLAEGAASGELRPLDPATVLVSLTGANTFYFISAPFYREISGRDPRDPDRLARQREALLDVAASVLFTAPEAGRALAARIHAATPGPAAGTRGEPS